MSGFIKLEPGELSSNLTDVTVTLTIPKKYVSRNSINLPDFTTNSNSIHEMLPLQEIGDAYVVGIHFSVYDKTEMLVLPFSLSFQAGTVPDNYQLHITAAVSSDGTTVTTEPNIYKPLYKDWAIEKFVNSNRIESFSKDGTEVVVTPQDEGGNPYLDDKTYVDFSFRINQMRIDNHRDVAQITLTDTLPTYMDKDGVSCIAAFDAEQNPGWTLSADKTTVSKTYTGENTDDVLKQIYDDELHLRFPGLLFSETDDNGFLIADLTNNVSMIAIPSNEAAGETRPTAQDSLIFRMTSNAGGIGSFTKVAEKGDIYDSDTWKANPYPWSIRLSNEKAQPLQHITIQDRKIIDVETGAVLLDGLDERLKFVRLESLADSRHSILPDGKTFADIIEKVVAYYADGSTEEYFVPEVDSSGNFSIAFDEVRVCEGYEIIFADDYEMHFGEAVHFRAYTVYRDLENTHADENNSQNNLYSNTARSVNWYIDRSGNIQYVYLTAGYGYLLLPFTEEINITKYNVTNSSTDNNTPGSRFIYLMYLTGSLLEDNVKEYENLRVIDLLPPGVSFDGMYMGTELFGNSYKPEIIENYHNSGRTAVIFHFEANALRAYWEKNIFAPFGLYVKINLDAKSGTIRNYAYVVGDNLEEYDNTTGGVPDIYDLNDNGRTDDIIACSYADAVIIAAQSIYADKYIAPAGSENWTQQGLIVHPGAEFDYLLQVTNGTSREHTGLVVYDTLPQIGDCDIIDETASRNSEFPVQLRGAIDTPAGYTVYYTTSEEVYSKPMGAILAPNSGVVWQTSVNDYSTVTAFQIVADPETILPAHSSFQVKVPVCAASSLDDQSLARLNSKTYQDQNSGTWAYLQAINSFGYTTDAERTEKESNTVWARISFAGFSLQKVDSQSGTGLAGAEFTLTNTHGEVIQTATSDALGNAAFYGLTEGTYTLTESKVPAGYWDSHVSLNVTITQNRVTMEYTITFGGTYSGIGTSADPLIIENVSAFELPNTGGTGTVPFITGGLLLMAGAVSCGYTLRYKRKNNY